VKNENERYLPQPENDNAALHVGTWGLTVKHCATVTADAYWIWDVRYLHQDSSRTQVFSAPVAAIRTFHGI